MLHLSQAVICIRPPPSGWPPCQDPADSSAPALTSGLMAAAAPGQLPAGPGPPPPAAPQPPAPSAAPMRPPPAAAGAPDLPQLVLGLPSCPFGPSCSRVCTTMSMRQNIIGALVSCRDKGAALLYTARAVVCGPCQNARAVLPGAALEVYLQHSTAWCGVVSTALAARHVFRLPSS
jgi:hypothetical protein